MSKVDVIVVGGGAAGLIASATAAKAGKRVLLLEKNSRLGMKILISGGGKCNLTHDGPMEELRAKFRPLEARFLKPSFYKFSNRDFLAILHQRGLQTYVRPDGRIFPVEPANAKSVVEILTTVAADSDVEIRTNAAVVGLLTSNGHIDGVRLEDTDLLAPSVILAVGGSSYPATGTTGDGWRWVREIGHTVNPLRAALAPISIEESRPDWSGISLRDIVVKGRSGKGGKEFVRWRGDLLYTHKGISGPTALGISREVAERLIDQTGLPKPMIEADLVPDTPFELLREQLRSAANEKPKQLVSAIVSGYGPARLMSTVLELSGVDPALRCSNLSAKQLTKVVSHLKEWSIGTAASVPLERGEVVAGGVELQEVDQQTMQSKMIHGLYLCGEILDIAGPVGGYNLQAAWSTGFVAGNSVATI